MLKRIITTLCLNFIVFSMLSQNLKSKAIDSLSVDDFNDEINEYLDQIESLHEFHYEFYFTDQRCYIYFFEKNSILYGSENSLDNKIVVRSGPYSSKSSFLNRINLKNDSAANKLVDSRSFKLNDYEGTLNYLKSNLTPATIICVAKNDQLLIIEKYLIIK